jgi:hypothetical protein
MTQQKDDVQAADPKEFGDFLQGLGLQTLRVRNLKVDADREFSHGDVLNIQHREKYAFETTEEGLLRIDTHHEIRLIGARKKILGSIKVVFSWYYRTETEMTDNLFAVFAPMVRFQTWPHLRELAQNIATRANWPRLTLPLLVTPAPAES